MAGFGAPGFLPGAGGNTATARLLGQAGGTAPPTAGGICSGEAAGAPLQRRLEELRALVAQPTAPPGWSPTGQAWTGDKELRLVQVFSTAGADLPLLVGGISAAGLWPAVFEHVQQPPTKANLIEVLEPVADDGLKADLAVYRSPAWVKLGRALAGIPQGFAQLWASREELLDKLRDAIIHPLIALRETLENLNLAVRAGDASQALAATSGLCGTASVQLLALAAPLAVIGAVALLLAGIGACLLTAASALVLAAGVCASCSLALNAFRVVLDAGRAAGANTVAEQGVTQRNLAESAPALAVTLALREITKGGLKVTRALTRITAPKAIQVRPAAQLSESGPLPTARPANPYPDSIDAEFTVVSEAADTLSSEATQAVKALPPAPGTPAPPPAPPAPALPPAPTALALPPAARTPATVPGQPPTPPTTALTMSRPSEPGPWGGFMGAVATPGSRTLFLEPPSPEWTPALPSDPGGFTSTAPPGESTDEAAGPPPGAPQFPRLAERGQVDDPIDVGEVPTSEPPGPVSDLDLLSDSTLAALKAKADITAALDAAGVPTDGHVDAATFDLGMELARAARHGLVLSRSGLVRYLVGDGSAQTLAEMPGRAGILARYYEQMVARRRRQAAGSPNGGPQGDAIQASGPTPATPPAPDPELPYHELHTGTIDPKDLERHQLETLHALTRGLTEPERTQVTGTPEGQVLLERVATARTVAYAHGLYSATEEYLRYLRAVLATEAGRRPALLARLETKVDGLTGRPLLQQVGPDPLDTTAPSDPLEPLRLRPRAEVTDPVQASPFDPIEPTPEHIHHDPAWRAERLTAELQLRTMGLAARDPLNRLARVLTQAADQDLYLSWDELTGRLAAVPGVDPEHGIAVLTYGVLSEVAATPQAAANDSPAPQMLRLAPREEVEDPVDVGPLDLLPALQNDFLLSPAGRTMAEQTAINDLAAALAEHGVPRSPDVESAVAPLGVFLADAAHHGRFVSRSALATTLCKGGQRAVDLEKAGSAFVGYVVRELERLRDQGIEPTASPSRATPQALALAKQELPPFPPVDGWAEQSPTVDEIVTDALEVRAAMLADLGPALETGEVIHPVLQLITANLVGIAYAKGRMPSPENLGAFLAAAPPGQLVDWLGVLEAHVLALRKTRLGATPGSVAADRQLLQAGDGLGGGATALLERLFRPAAEVEDPVLVRTPLEPTGQPVDPTIWAETALIGELMIRMSAEGVTMPRFFAGMVVDVIEQLEATGQRCSWPGLVTVLAMGGPDGVFGQLKQIRRHYLGHE